jgi:hypothetical protein
MQEFCIMNEGTGIIIQILALVGAAGILFLLTWRRHMQNLFHWFTDQRARLIHAYQAYQSYQGTSIIPGQSQNTYNLSVIPDAGQALAHPPSNLQEAISYISNDSGFDYDLVIGWYRVNNSAHCLSAPLVGDVYHTLITGMSRAGKDNLALNALLALAIQYNPEQVQFCIIDGKGLDFCEFEGKAHTWHLALKPSEIGAAMEALSKERDRRGDILRGAKVSKWENYQNQDLPLLVIYVSELSLLEGAVGKRQLTDWLNQELAAGAAFGMRYIIATQTASNFDTRWRSQVSLYLAAFQPSQSQDQPNTGLTTNEVKTAGGIPPSELPAPPTGAGVFTCVQGRSVYVARAGLMDDRQRQRLLNKLPLASFQELVPSVPADTNGKYHREPEPVQEPVQEPVREPEIREKIRQLANDGWSRNKIAAEIGGKRERTLALIRDVLESVEVETMHTT